MKKWNKFNKFLLKSERIYNENKNRINNAKKPNNLSIIMYEINVALLKNLYLLIRYIIFIKSPPVAPGKHWLKKYPM